MKPNVLVGIKSMLVTIFLLIFMFLMLFIANKGQEKLNGEGIFLKAAKNAIYIKKGDLQYKIAPNREDCCRLLTHIYNHPQCLPAPFNFAIWSNYFLNSISHLIKYKTWRV